MEIQPGIDIYLGDCLEGLKSLPDESVDYTFTDPPYNINFQSQRRPDKLGKVLNDNLPTTEFQKWLGGGVDELFRVHKPDTALHVCTRWDVYPIFYAEFSRRFKVRACIVWRKNNFGLGYHIRPQHEFIMLCLKGEPKPPAKAPSDVWDFSKVQDLSHSCEKPVALVEFAMDLYTKPGDLTLDPFLGSGTTADAAYRTGRRFKGWELDPGHFETTKNRFRQVRFALV